MKYTIFTILILQFSISKSQQVIRGKILNQKNEVLLGATVQNGISGSYNYYDGFEILVHIPDTIVVSFIGYEKKEVILKDTNYVIICLKQNDVLLDEIHIIEYNYETWQTSHGHGEINKYSIQMNANSSHSFSPSCNKFDLSIGFSKSFYLRLLNLRTKDPIFIGLNVASSNNQIYYSPYVQIKINEMLYSRLSFEPFVELRYCLIKKNRRLNYKLGFSFLDIPLNKFGYGCGYLRHQLKFSLFYDNDTYCSFYGVGLSYKFNKGCVTSFYEHKRLK